MSIAPPAQTLASKVLPLEPGDEMTVREFRRRDAVTLDALKPELVEGFVHLAAATRFQHGNCQNIISTWLGNYCMETDGTDSASDATDRLDDRNEPRPDVAAFVTPNSGGRCRIDDEGYLAGPPELIAEIASSTETLDRGMKRRAYGQNGVDEYLVWRTRIGRIECYRRTGSELILLPPPDDGVFRSLSLPGLWLNLAAAVDRDRRSVHQTLLEGLATDKHAAFVSRLAEAKHRHESSDAG